MEKVIFIETGTGIDVHGQDVNAAAIRAVDNAIHTNSMPGIGNMLPDGNINKMEVLVKLAVPIDEEAIDKSEIKERIPQGNVTVEVEKGGMATSHGIYLEEHNDKSNLMYIVNAAIEVGY